MSDAPNPNVASSFLNAGEDQVFDVEKARTANHNVSWAQVTGDTLALSCLLADACDEIERLREQLKAAEAVVAWAEDATRFMHDGCGCPGCRTRWERGDSMLETYRQRSPKETT